MRGFPRRRLLLAAGAGVVVSACSSPNPSLYTLAPVQGTVAGGGPKVVVLHQISVARYLERPEIVRSSENYRLDVAGNDMWGEPIAPMIGRILAADLTQRMPGTTFITSNGAISAQGNAAVEVNIQRMDTGASGALVFAAQAAVEFTAPRQAEATRTINTTVPVASTATADEVRAMSIAIGQLADAIAQMLREAGSRAGRV